MYARSKQHLNTLGIPMAANFGSRTIGLRWVPSGYERTEPWELSRVEIGDMELGWHAERASEAWRLLTNPDCLALSTEDVVKAF